MNLRPSRRAVSLAWALMVCKVRLLGMRLRGPLTPVRRALWLQSACRGVLRSLGIRYAVVGRPPQSGLVVSNHLSYLDIAIFSAAMPCVFVSKSEVARWPYFGGAARAGGTIFVDRSSRASAAKAGNQIGERLRLPVPVLLFPEGTSSDGARVLRFHTALFQPAIEVGAPVTAAAVRYVLEGGEPERELCWFGDEGFLTHLWKVLGCAGFSAEITFSESRFFEDRRRAAVVTQGIVEEMRAECRRLGDVEVEADSVA